MSHIAMGQEIVVEMPSNEEKKTNVQVTPVSPGLEGKRTHRGRRQASLPITSTGQQVGYDGEENTVNRLGKIYERIRDFNIVTRNLIYILPIAILLAIPLIIFATAHKDARAGGIRLLGVFIWLQVAWWSFW